MGYYCTVPQCTSLAGKTKNVKFHKFPSDKTLAHRWNEILHRNKPFTKYSKVCSLHFMPTDYNITTMGQWKTLSKDAIPTQNLPRLNADGTVMVIRKSRTVKYKPELGELPAVKKDGRDAGVGGKREWGVTVLRCEGSPSRYADVDYSPVCGSVVTNRMNTLNAFASTLPTQLKSTFQAAKPLKHDAIMQTDPQDTLLQREMEDSQESHPEKENVQNETLMEEDYETFSHVEKNPKNYSKESVYDKELDYSKGDDLSKAAESYALERNNKHSGSYEAKSPGCYKRQDTYSKLPETYNESPDAYDKLPESYNKSQESYSKLPESYNKSIEVYNKLAETLNKQPETYTKGLEMYNKLSETYNKSPELYNKIQEAYNKSPELYNKLQESYNKSPELYNKLQESYNKSPDSYNNSPESYNKMSEPYNKSPETYNKSPETYNKSPETYNKSPETYNKSPETYNKSPETYNKSPESYNELPESYHKSPVSYEKLPESFDKSPEAFDKQQSQDAYIKQQDLFLNGEYIKSDVSSNESYQSRDSYGDGCSKSAEAYPRLQEQYAASFAHNSVEVLRSQQQGLQMLQRRMASQAEDARFYGNRIKEEMDLNNDEEKFLAYEAQKEEYLQSGEAENALFTQQQRHHLLQQQQRLMDLYERPTIKQEPDIRGCETVMPPQPSPVSDYYRAEQHAEAVPTNAAAAYYGQQREEALAQQQAALAHQQQQMFIQPGAELLIAKQNALAAHTTLWQNAKRPFFYGDNAQLHSQLHPRYEDLARMLNQ